MVAALFDTTVGILLLRRKEPPETLPLLRAAKSEIERGSALLPAMAVTELVLGERDPAGSERLSSALAKIPTAVLPAEAARDAGAMGSFLRAEGAPIPVPDLLIAATAVWLGLPLLTWDGDYARSRERAVASRSPHRGAELWKALVLHSASRGA
jgi:predicted nucleic acid-binding protein